MPPSEEQRVELLERLLADDTLRARFRLDPASAARAAGFEGLAEELASGPRRSFETLDLRESRSNLAGMLMAAAAEGIGLLDGGHGQGGGSHQVSDKVGRISNGGEPRPGTGEAGARASPPAPEGGSRAAASPAAPMIGAATPEEAAAEQVHGDAPGLWSSRSAAAAANQVEQANQAGQYPVVQDVPGQGSANGGGAGQLAEFAGQYPGDDASPEQIAGWMGAEAEKRGIPPELPVMAALVESNLENLNYGDADSIGFFQMRASIWDQGEYAGYGDDPEKQIDWFLDHAQEVKKQRLAAGLSTNDPSQYGEWIADIERPAEEYRGRYQPMLAQAQELLKDAPAGSDQGVPVDTRGGAGSLVGWATKQVGVQEGSDEQIKWAENLGLSPSTPWCSIFVATAVKQMGLEIPSNPAYSGSWLEWGQGHGVSLDQIRPGDIVVFDWGDGGMTDHVAIYAGNGQVIGGNQSDAVTKVPLSRDNVVGVIRPPISEGNAPVLAAERAPAPEPGTPGPPDRAPAEAKRPALLSFGVGAPKPPEEAQSDVQFLEALPNEPEEPA
jgi:uncharacterized protein (TIGR02594 family)